MNSHLRVGFTRSTLQFLRSCAPATTAAARSGSLKASRRGSATSQSGAPPPPLMVDTADRASNIDTLAPPSAPSGAPKERTKTYVA